MVVSALREGANCPTPLPEFFSLQVYGANSQKLVAITKRFVLSGVKIGDTPFGTNRFLLSLKPDS